jgi:citrate synthase
MNEEIRLKNTGLRGVTVADSAISFIDGEKGVLIYRGYRIEDLADRSSFMETVYLLVVRRPAHRRATGSVHRSGQEHASGARVCL